MTATKTRIDDPLPQLIDIKTVAARLDVTIPYIKVGYLIRFDPDEIDRWLNDARRPPIAG